MNSVDIEHFGTRFHFSKELEEKKYFEPKIVQLRNQDFGKVFLQDDSDDDDEKKEKKKYFAVEIPNYLKKNKRGQTLELVSTKRA